MWRDAVNERMVGLGDWKPVDRFNHESKHWSAKGRHIEWLKSCFPEVHQAIQNDPMRCLLCQFVWAPEAFHSYFCTPSGLLKFFGGEFDLILHNSPWIDHCMSRRSEILNVQKEGSTRKCHQKWSMTSMIIWMLLNIWYWHVPNPGKNMAIYIPTTKRFTSLWFTWFHVKKPLPRVISYAHGDLPKKKI